MIEIKGKYDTAKVFAVEVEESAMEQLQTIVNHPAMEGAHVRIMPDVHAGAGCVIGFTARVTDKIIPNLIGVDIGCGVLSASIISPLGRGCLPAFDELVRDSVPLGFHVHNVKSEIFTRFPITGIGILGEVQDICKKIGMEYSYALASIGTLGGGNHFIELDEKDGKQLLVVHSGSRNLGLKVANYYQHIANENHPEAPKGLAWLEGIDAENYIKDLQVIQAYAKLNRHCIIEQIGLRTNIKAEYQTESVHNYIQDGIIRKGAISAQLGESVIIPMNMRDGTIIGTGIGLEDWNYSAPHGAGRVMSRSFAKKHVTLDEFEKSMQGIYSTSVREDTLDESPMAYKPIGSIVDAFENTLMDMQIVKPIWNIKA